jgi:hypothetical protein
MLIIWKRTEAIVKLYIIDSEPQMGAIKKAVVSSFDNNQDNYKNVKKYERKKSDILELYAKAV